MCCLPQFIPFKRYNLYSLSNSNSQLAETGEGGLDVYEHGTPAYHEQTEAAGLIAELAGSVPTKTHVTVIEQ